MHCWGPHTNVGGGLPTFPTTSQAKAQIRNVEGPGQMLHMVRGPEEGSPNTYPTLGLLQDLLVTDPRSLSQRF